MSSPLKFDKEKIYKRKGREKEYQKEWRLKNKEHLREWEKSRIRDPLKQYYYGLKKSALSRNLEFNLTHDDIVIPEYCPVLGLKINRGDSLTEDSPSFDRIDNTKGYTKDNIQVISWRANRIKSDASLEELEKICNYVRTFKI